MLFCSKNTLNVLENSNRATTVERKAEFSSHLFV
jgi:hypothetical protein